MLIILDRDGVINQDSDQYIKSADEWQPIPGSIDAIVALKQVGHTVVIATNQSGIARGLFTLDDLNAMHDKLKQLLAVQHTHIDGIYFCPHVDADQCDCRKPKPGLLQQIATDFQADLTEAWLIGDSIRDLQAGASAGCQLALVKTGKGKRSLQADFDFSNTQVFHDLKHFSQTQITHA